MIDEVASEKRAEFVGGKLFCVDEEGQVSKSMLCYMIQAVGGKFKDMVAMFPTSRLDAKVVSSHFSRILSTLTDIGFDVVVVSLDG